MRFKITTFFTAFFMVAILAGTNASAQTNLNRITNFKIEEGKNGTHVRIKGSAIPTFSVFKLNAPLRLFVDVANSELAGDAKSIKVNNGVLSQISILEFKDSHQSVTRIIIGFDKSAHYDVKTEGNDVVVFVDGQKRSRPMANLADEMRRDNSAKQIQKLKEVERRYKALLNKNAEKIASTSNALNQTRASLQSREKELKELRADKKRLSGEEKTRVEQQILALKRSVNASKSQIANKKEELASLKGDIGRIERQQKTDRKALLKFQKEAKRSQVERDAALALARTKEKEGKLAIAKAKVFEEKLASLERNLNSLSVERSNAQTKSKMEIAAKQKEIEQAKAKQKALAAELEVALKQSDSSKVRTLETRRKSIAKNLLAKENELRRAKGKQKKMLQQVDTLTHTLASRDKQIRELNAQIKRANKEAKRAEIARVNALRSAVNTERKQVSRREKGGRLAKAVALNPMNAINGIQLETSKGRSKIIIDLDTPGSFETISGDSRAVMILNNVKLPESLEKTLANRSEGGAVRFVSTYRDIKGRVRLEVELNEDAKESIHQDGNKLVWEFAPSMKNEFPQQEFAVNQGRPKDASYTARKRRYPRVVVDPTQVSRVPGMRRVRMTIDLREVDIQNVLRMIAKEGGVNIVVGEGVSGNVTMRLKRVPVDEVFLTVLQARGLGFEKRGNVIRVAPQDKLRAEQKVRSEARAAARGKAPLEVFLLRISYATAADMEKQISGLISPRGNVTVDERTNTLIIRDVSANIKTIRQLAANLDSQIPQVLIEARIVETNDTFVQQVGIQWGGDLNFSQANGNPTGLVFPSNVGIGGGSTDGRTPTAGTSPAPNFAVNLPAPAGTGAGGALGLALGSVGGALNINLRLSALEAAGHAKIVSAPKILTLDNHEAKISQGTSIPISVVGAAGVQTVFVDATLELTVRPHVTPDGNIQLKIQATKNEPDFQNTGARGDPTIIRKEAQTELLVKDGDTTVIGGIYTRNSGSAISAIPFFHKIPVLGFFFRTETESDRRTELLIFITPKIVNRAEALGSMSPGTVESQPEAKKEQ